MLHVVRRQGPVTWFSTIWPVRALNNYLYNMMRTKSSHSTFQLKQYWTCEELARGWSMVENCNHGGHCSIPENRNVSVCSITACCSVNFHLPQNKSEKISKRNKNSRKILLSKSLFFSWSSNKKVYLSVYQSRRKSYILL